MSPVVLCVGEGCCGVLGGVSRRKLWLLCAAVGCQVHLSFSKKSEVLSMLRADDDEQV